MSPTTPNFILSHSGKQHSYHVAHALNQLGFLYKFYTSTYISNRFIQKTLRKLNNQFWTKRFHPGLFGNTVQSNWRFEIYELLYRKFYGKNATFHNLVFQRDIKFDSYIEKKILSMSDNHTSKLIFWGFQGSCFYSLKACKKKNIATICEQSASYISSYEKIFSEEKKLHPEWLDSFEQNLYPKGYERRLIEEPFLADYIMVASEYTKLCLIENGLPDSKIVKLPLGADVSQIQQVSSFVGIASRPLKILYVGRISQSKGIKYLLEASKEFKKSDVEFHVLGAIQGSGEAFKKYKQHIFYHPPVYQSVLFSLYKEFDALVLPSLSEGFGLAIVEALAAGLPVITTANTIGPELITDDHNGYIVPIRSVKNIVGAIEKLRSKSDIDYSIMSENAIKTAYSYSWDNYKDNLFHLIKMCGFFNK